MRVPPVPILICVALAVALTLPAAASADDYYAGKAEGHDSLILIHAEQGQLTQVLLHVRSKCTIDGRPSRSSFGYDELKGVKVRDGRFRKDRRYAAPTTGIEQPSYKWRIYVAGRILRDSLELRFETKFIDNHHTEKQLCASGRQETKLQEISKGRYQNLISKTPFEPR